MYRLAVRPLDLEVIGLPAGHGLFAGIIRGWIDLDLLAIGSVLVHTRQDVERILPAAEHGQVARCVRVGEAGRRRLAVAPDLRLDVAVRRVAHRVEFDPGVDGERALEPNAVIVGALAT